MKLPYNYKVGLSIKPVDEAGNPALVENIVWTSTPLDVVELVPADDGLSCTVKALGKVGVAQVEVTADALIGEGIENISDFLSIEVTAGKAVNLGIIAGVPEPQ